MIDERNISSAAEFIAIHSFRPTLHEIGIPHNSPINTWAGPLVVDCPEIHRC